MATSPEPVPRRAAIYARISDAGNDKDDALGIKRQEQRCRELAETLGWSVVEVYVDNSVSAWSRKPRPGYLQMLDDIRSGHINAVLAFGADRLHRNSEEHVAFLRLAGETGVIVQTITGGRLDHHTAGGKFQSKIAADVAEYESDIRSERVKAKMAELRANGRTQGGRRPFGLTDGRKDLVPEEAALIREAAEVILSGGKLYRIVQDWNTRGFTTVAGKSWTATRIKEILAAQWTRGLTPDGTRAQWPAILDQVTAQRLEAVLLDPSRKQRRPDVKRHLLTGLLVCGRCGGDQRMQSWNTNGHRGYGCSGAGCWTRIKAEPVEEDVVGRLIPRIPSEMVAEGLHEASQVTVDDASVLALDAHAAELADMLGKGEIDRAGYKRAKDRLDERRAALTVTYRRDLALERRQAARLAAFDMAERWEQLDIDQRRQVLGAFIETIVVGPALKGRPRYDTDRIKIYWRS